MSTETTTTTTETQTTAASAPAAPISAAVESFAASAYEKAAPYFSPLVEGAKARLPTDVVDRLDKAAASATTAAHSLLEHADGAALSVSGKLEDLRKTPDFVKGKVVEGTEFVKAKVADGEGFVKSKVAAFGLPTSFAELKEASATQLTNLKAALGKLVESLPGAQPGHKFEVIPEAQVEKIRGAVGKVLESLPKLPAFELPKIDLAAYTPQELVKFGHKLVEQLSPYVAPYQARVQKLLTDYKVTEYASAYQKQAVELYKNYKLDQYAPKFVNSFLVGEASAPAVAAQ